MHEPARETPLEAYLALEEASEAKHEYVGARIVAMAGATPRHNLIAANVTRALGNLLDEVPCRVLGSDQRVRLGMSRDYVYPDAVVVCDAPQLSDERPPSLENPVVVVEVLSPSTEDRDRGRKLSGYRRLASVQEVLLLSTNERRAEVVRREANGRWVIVDVTEGTVSLQSLDVHLQLDTLYAKTHELALDPVAD